MYRIGVPGFDMSYTYDSVSNNGQLMQRNPGNNFKDLSGLLLFYFLNGGGGK